MLYTFFHASIVLHSYTYCEMYMYTVNVYMNSVFCVHAMYVYMYTYPSIQSENKTWGSQECSFLTRCPNFEVSCWLMHPHFGGVLIEIASVTEDTLCSMQSSVPTETHRQRRRRERETVSNSWLQRMRNRWGGREGKKEREGVGGLVASIWLLCIYEKERCQ